MLEFAGPLVSIRGFDPQYASVFDRYAASTRSLLRMFRFNFNTMSGKDNKPIKIRPATQNTQRVEISIRNATRRKRSGSGPLSWGSAGPRWGAREGAWGGCSGRCLEGCSEGAWEGARDWKHVDTMSPQPSSKDLRATATHASLLAMFRTICLSRRSGCSDDRTLPRP